MSTWGLQSSRGLTKITPDSGEQLQDIVANIVVEEVHTDLVEVTDHPVEYGAMISDHAYKRPVELALYLGWSDSVENPYGSDIAAELDTLSGLPDIYASLLKMMDLRSVFSVTTGKRTYNNMVCTSLSVETTEKTENSLFVRMTCREVIRVSTRTITFPTSSQAMPKKTASITERGTTQVQNTYLPDYVDTSGWGF